MHVSSHHDIRYHVHMSMRGDRRPPRAGVSITHSLSVPHGRRLPAATAPWPSQPTFVIRTFPVHLGLDPAFTTTNLPAETVRNGELPSEMMPPHTHSRTRESITYAPLFLGQAHDGVELRLRRAQQLGVLCAQRWHASSVQAVEQASLLSYLVRRGRSGARI